MSDPVAVEQHGEHVGVVRLCRPPNNFFDTALLHEVAETRADLDSSVIHEAVQRAVTWWPDEP